MDGGGSKSFTWPRRFGKSLNMSMMKAFFEAGGDKSLFAGLEISSERELCAKYMGQQINRNKYAEELKREGCQRVLKYGIACWKKECEVLMSEE